MRMGLAVTAAAVALAAAGCGNRRAQLQAQANERRILELSDENHQLGQQLAAAQAQVAALQAQVASLQGKVAELMRPPARPEPAPRAAAPASKPPPAPVEIPQALRDKGVKAIERDGHPGVLLPGAVLFASGQATLSTEARSTLRQVAGLIQKHYPHARIRIEGHTDNEPIQKTKKLYKDNEALSEARAKAVRDFFAKDAKIAAGRLETAGHGEAKPVADNKTAAGRRQNRRVELVLLTDDR